MKYRASLIALLLLLFLTSAVAAQSRADEAGADLAKPTEQVRTVQSLYVTHYDDPLTQAVADKDPGRIQALLAERANPNFIAADGNTALELAIRNGDPDVVRWLLDAGADLNSVQTDGGSLFAINGGDTVEMVGMLVAHGADVNRTDSRGKTPLIRFASNDGSDLLQAFIDRGARMNAQDHFGNSPLIEAAATGNLDAMGTLLRAGADVNLRNASGLDAFQLASSNGYRAAADLLVAAGASRTTR